MGLFDNFPYTNFHELNLDWILRMLKQIDTTMDQFVAINSLKFADPIQWSITSQYEKNTIVIDPLTGTAYISTQAVPSGVALSNTDYWTVVFDLGSFVVRAAKNFTNRYEKETTNTATFASSENDWLVWGDTLYKVIVPTINAGDQYIVDSNIKHITMEELYNALDARVGDLDNLNTSDKTSIVNAINSIENLSGLVVTPEMFGAAGDGVTDDRNAFITAFSIGKIVYCAANYLISDSITMPANTILMGSGTLIFDDANSGYRFSGIYMNSGCKIDGLSFTNTNTTYDAIYACIYAGNKTDISVTNCTFNNLTIGYAMLFVESFHGVIANNNISNYSYSGIMLLNGCQYFEIEHNYIYNARHNQSGNNYPISISGYLDIASRPAKYIKCNYNHIEEVTAVWEGIDSHSCENCEIIGNTINGTSRGIVLASPTTPTLQTGRSLYNVVVSNNVITCTSDSTGIASGIIASIGTNGRGIIENLTINNNIIEITNNATLHASVNSAIGVRSTFNNVTISHNQIVNDSNGIWLESFGDSENATVDNNDISGASTAADYCINLSTIGTSGTKHIIVENNYLHDAVRSYRGSISALDDLIECRNNIDTINVTNNIIYDTYPKGVLPTDTAARGHVGLLIPSTGSGQAFWYCRGVGDWVAVS